MRTPAEYPSQASLAAALLADGICVRMQVRGTSMAPTLRSGDVVELEPVPPASLGIGDIVLTPGPEGGWLLHRVLRRVPYTGWLQTRGDALWRLDTAVCASRIAGRVRRAERHGNRLFRRRPVLDRLRASLLLLGSGLRYRLSRLRRQGQGDRSRLRLRSRARA